MHKLVVSILEGLIVALVALGVGFAGNACMGASDAIDLHYAYCGTKPAGKPTGPDGDPPPTIPREEYVETDWFSPELRPDELPEIQGFPGCRYVPFNETKSFQNELLSAQALALFEHEGRQQGAIVFVDARNEAKYESGHIPGAVLLDHYRFNAFWPAAEAAVLRAFVVVIYCDGGDCEDSVNLASVLKMDPVRLPEDRVFIYRGGMMDWEAQGRPVERSQ